MIFFIVSKLSKTNLGCQKFNNHKQDNWCCSDKTFWGTNLRSAKNWCKLPAAFLPRTQPVTNHINNQIDNLHFDVNIHNPMLTSRQCGKYKLLVLAGWIPGRHDPTRSSCRLTSQHWQPQCRHQPKSPSRWKLWPLTYSFI